MKKAGFGTLRFASVLTHSNNMSYMWLAIARPNLLRLRFANFTYPWNVRKNLIRV